MFSLQFCQSKSLYYESVPQWVLWSSSFLGDPLITAGAIPHIKVWHGTCSHHSAPTGLQPTAEFKILLGGQHRGQPSLALDYGRRHLTNLIPCTLLSMQSFICASHNKSLSWQNTQIYIGSRTTTECVFISVFVPISPTALLTKGYCFTWTRQASCLSFLL